jgi:predicted amidophosphoribosyltransferase
VLDLLLPRRCLVCGVDGTQLCGSCLDGLPRLGSPLCARCGAPTAWPVARCRECAGRRIAFASARAAVAYDDAVRRIVSAWKERGLRALSGEAAGVVVATLPHPGAATVTFVPPDAGRRLERGHHPAERLARALAAHWELRCEPLLARRGAGRRQRGLALAERRRNVAHAFRGTAAAPARVILVDDVYTTGATVASAASALRAGGARAVHVVTFARTIRR